MELDTRWQQLQHQLHVRVRLLRAVSGAGEQAEWHPLLVGTAKPIRELLRLRPA